MTTAFRSTPFWAKYPWQLPQYGAKATGVFAIDAATDGVCLYFVSPVSAKLSKFYVYVPSAVGTPPDLQAQVYGPAAGGALGSSIANYSDSAAGRGTAGWVLFEFTDGARASLSAGSGYNVAISSSGADASNYNNIGVSTNNIFNTATYANGASLTTTNSFSSITLNNRGGVPFVAVFDDGLVHGFPYVSADIDANNTRQRGIYMPTLTKGFSVVGVEANIANQNAIKVYKNGTLDSTKDASGYFAPYEFIAGSDYRLVYDYGASNTRPGFIQIVDPDSYQDVLDARFGGDWHYTEFDGTNWVESPLKYPCVSLLMGGVETAASGAGVRLLDFNGGFR